MSSQKSFTLIELLVVIAAIGLISSIVLVSIKGTRSKARDSRRLTEATQIIKALEFYYNTNNSYPLAPGWNFTSFGDTKNWIPGLAPQFIGFVPDDVLTENCHPNTPEICYYYRSTTGQAFCLQISLENPPSGSIGAKYIFGPEPGGIYKIRYNLGNIDDCAL